MKKNVLFILLTLSFILNSGFAEDLRAQTVNRKSAPKLAGNSKKTPSPLKAASIKTILQNRKAGNVPSGDPCSTAVPITVGQTLNGSLLAGDCQLGDNTLIDFYSFHGTTGQPVFISETSGAFDTYLYLLDDQGNIVIENDDTSDVNTDSRIPPGGGVVTLPFTGDYIIGANSFAPTTGAYSLTLGTDAACTTTSIAYNQTVNGNLANTSCAVNIAGAPFFTDLYTFNGVAGQQISITMTSSAVNSYLILHEPTLGGSEDDNSGGGNNARIPTSGLFTLPESGTYAIEASTFNSGEMGSYSLNLTGPSIAVKSRADFDGDGKTDLSAYRPSDGNWYIFQSGGGGAIVRNWGVAGDVLTPGDYDGDGKTDTAAYRPSTGQWLIFRSSDSTVNILNFGIAGDRPVPGDYDGDGKTDVAQFRPSEGVWYVFRSSDNGVSITTWGEATDLTVPADYDGDGKTDVAVFRPSTGVWYVFRSTAGPMVVGWGVAGDKPVEADYDGDGKDDVAIYRPSEGNWYVFRSFDNSVQIVNWGNATDVPSPGDYDGDGKDDFAVFRNGTWFAYESTAGPVVSSWGAAGDTSIPSTYIP